MESAFSETQRAAELLQQFGGIHFSFDHLLPAFSAIRHSRSCPAALLDQHSVLRHPWHAQRRFIALLPRWVSSLAMGIQFSRFRAYEESFPLIRIRDNFRLFYNQIEKILCKLLRLWFPLHLLAHKNGKTQPRNFARSKIFVSARKNPLIPYRRVQTVVVRKKFSAFHKFFQLCKNFYFAVLYRHVRNTSFHW